MSSLISILISSMLEFHKLLYIRVNVRICINTYCIVWNETIFVVLVVPVGHRSMMAVVAAERVGRQVGVDHLDNPVVEVGIAAAAGIVAVHILDHRTLDPDQERVRFVVLAGGR